MECRDVQNLIHPFVDGELDLVRRLQIEHHLDDCRECAEREQGLRQLRELLAAPPLYHRAPDSLRARLQTAPAPPTAPVSAPAHTPPARPRRFRARVLVAIAAGLMLLVTTSLTAGVLLSRSGRAEDRLAEQVVASHIRSLQVTHKTDVPSSNQHVVKPWFQGKVDFSPQVPDLSAAGFTLSGGRMDYLVDRPVAALVYYRRDHPINVFTWPISDGEGERGVRALHRQGFHIRQWQHSGMAYWVISDLNAQELDEFVKLFQAHSTVTVP